MLTRSIVSSAFFKNQIINVKGVLHFYNKFDIFLKSISKIMISQVVSEISAKTKFLANFYFIQLMGGINLLMVISLPLYELID